MLYLAFGAGVYGYLFPGNINMMLMHLYEQKRYALLAGVLLLALLFEFLYCFVAITFCGRLGADAHIATTLSYAGCVLSVIFGMWILLEPVKPAGSHTGAIIARGVISIIVHPQQVPFWLFVYAIIRPFGHIASAAQFAVFDILGCTVIYSLYIYGGTRLLRTYNVNRVYVHKAVGVLYVVSAFASVYKMVIA